MKSEVFRFKYFELQIAENVFPVTTDSVLLGAWVHCEGIESVLDLGTGSGILGLMLAQRSADNCQIYGLDVHRESVECAKNNFLQTPWKTKLNVIHLSILDILIPQRHPFLPFSLDLIICNPPYFKGQLNSEDINVSRAKHQSQFDFNSLVKIAEQLLSETGTLAVVLPHELEYKLTSVCLKAGLTLKRMCKVYHRANVANSLCLCEYTKSQHKPEISEIVLYDENNQRTREYAALTKDYYL
ncbi:MAG: methyltransferase [Saprospiraceae bacterium]|nr:methyltransferase [Saprospiraceae bacterium]